ncbi:NAD dependent epimerase/dehydratase family protein [Xylona heveae TC161]|uniref:NAD dependent epimerase/dehydratase family protein n=1 Tax=Xylona heveae (strain CBS 132557 / TC161) TaxID=1328760 RepID=A0A165FV90_XYLHT|nr:NAD dependent epimerase/dehydratase family protein [Xylona heveae TC161]KZF21420.1 NAD dependent epimerase/dehydratase family protein [Xylona heveae TC161]
MPSAIVTGATGILGREIVFALGKDPQKWQTVYALSRSQKEDYPSNVQHGRIDLQAGPQELAKQLQGIEAEYLFFTAYLQKDSEQENWDTNGAMLENFLEALSMTGAEKKLKRVILTTGAKQYGLHLGPAKNPMEESDPEVKGSGRPPNFYYRQQEALRTKSKGKGWDWVVTYPNVVIGVAKGNFMNFATALGIYATVTKELKEPFIFPGNPDLYTGFDCFTYSQLHAQFCLWAALEPKCANENFNVVNGDVQSWQTLWPKVATKFGVHIPAKQFSLKAGVENEVELIERPPIADQAAEMGIVDRIYRGKLIMKVDLTKWAQRPEVKKAWDTVVARHGLDKDAFDKATWLFLNFVLGKNSDVVINMTKARKLGWTGYYDTWDSLSESLDDLADEKILPKF